MPILFLTNSLFVFSFKRWLGPIGTFYMSLTSLGLLLGNCFVLLGLIVVRGGYWFIDLGRWFFCLNWFDSHLLFCIDLLGLVAAILVLVLTMLASSFGVEYMYREAFINRLLYLLNLFALSVFLLFFCYDLFLILLAWECIGLFSLLLVNFYSNRIYTIKAALKTFILSRLSDLNLFIFFVLTLLNFHTTDLSLIFLQIPFMAFHYMFVANVAIHFLTLYALTLVGSGTIKSAQFLAHVWLPDAMEAPTPASALIHSSTLVVAGVFLILRFALLFEFTPVVNYGLAVLGAVTLAFAAIVATFQTDIKKLVAFSTISQIGYLVCGCGFLCYEEVLMYLIIHALNKAFLFIGVGYLVHFFAHNTDLRQMGSAFLMAFDLAVLLLGVSLNLCGLPYSAGFIGKEFLIFQFFGNDTVALLVRACWLVSFGFTPLYMGLLLWIALFGGKRGRWNSYTLAAYEGYGMPLGVMRGWRVLAWTRVVDQFTPMTSGVTSCILVTFWVGIFWGGEHLMLILLGYLPLGDLGVGGAFTTLQSFEGFENTFWGARLSVDFASVLWGSILGSIIYLVGLKRASHHELSSFATLREGVMVLGVLWCISPWGCMVCCVVWGGRRWFKRERE